MPNVPLHPALVHLPIGLALVAPALVLGIGVAVLRGALPRRAWWIAVGLQVFLVAGGIAAAQLGDREEKLVARVVPKSLIHEHEERAEAFLWSAGLGVGALAAAGLLLAARPRSAVALAVATTLATAGLALYAGKAGGALVYDHGAASAWHSDPAPVAVRR
ncbi:MAG: DUF2231 domain-containing protein [Anaeromyxobacteraceae bacterium]